MDKTVFNPIAGQLLVSIIVGFCLSKIWTVLVQHIQYRRKHIFYLPYFMHMGQMSFHLILLLLRSAVFYEDPSSAWQYLNKMAYDSSVIIYILLSLPPDDSLGNKHLSLENFYKGAMNLWLPACLLWHNIVPTFMQWFFTDLRLENRMDYLWDFPMECIICLPFYLCMIRWKNKYFCVFFHFIWFLIPFLLVLEPNGDWFVGWQ